MRRRPLLGTTALSSVAWLTLPWLVALASRGMIPAALVSGFLLPQICLSWGLFCGALWFRPDRGLLRNRPQLPAPVHLSLSLFRVVAAVLLTIFVVVGTVVPLVLGIRALHAS